MPKLQLDPVPSTPEQIWDAITSSDYTLKYDFASTVDSEWTAGSPYTYRIDGRPAIVGEVLESVPNERLVATPTYEQIGGGMPLILSGLKTLLETGKPLMGEPVPA